MQLTTHQLEYGYPGKRGNRIGGPSDLVLSPGEVVCLLGPNGCGKSTLLRTLSGLLPALGGEISFGGDSLQAMDSKELARRRSVVLTRGEVPPLLRGEDLVALGRHPHLSWNATLSQKDHTVIDSVIESVKASGLRHRYLHEMSDGERQRFAIARALAQESPLLLLDEPSTFLDLPGRFELFAILRSLAHESGKGILLSTHDLDLSLRTADQLWLMDQDRIVQGCPEDLILGGHLQRVFSKGNIKMEFRDGQLDWASSFPRKYPTFRVEGSGDALHWTTKALERSGYSVDNDSISPLIHIQPKGADYEWTLHLSNQNKISYPLLQKLLDALRDQSQ